MRDFFKLHLKLCYYLHKHLVYRISWVLFCHQLLGSLDSDKNSVSILFTYSFVRGCSKFPPPEKLMLKFMISTSITVTVLLLLLRSYSVTVIMSLSLSLSFSLSLPLSLLLYLLQSMAPSMSLSCNCYSVGVCQCVTVPVCCRNSCCCCFCCRSCSFSNHETFVQLLLSLRRAWPRSGSGFGFVLDLKLTKTWPG